ncbi:diguanylate cyclase domain-containing protein [Priestia aryabhattai]|uniref:diguanylate cyclase domain-containing protein n=1 Tax=Priestia aryabhattai TaxID=412384 RepID=UPI002E1A414D|nr:diguanylate cyclase [Priestia aryabhattai]MED4024299.1 diguanylate cyclase [Priestia aryabhattai]
MYSEGVFQFYFMNMPQPVILIQQEKHQLYYKECNKAAQQFFDKMENEIINKEENLLFYTLCEKAIATKEPIQYQHIQLFQPDRHAYEVTFTPLFNQATNPSHVLVMAQEIHYKKTQEESTRLLDAFLENTVDAILIADCDEKVLTVNGAFEKLFQWRKEEAIGKSRQEMNIVSKKEEQENLKLIAELKNGKTLSPYETVRYKKSGESVCVSVSCSPIYDHQNQLVAYSVIYRDITAIKRLELELIKSKQWYKSLFTNHHHAVCMLNLDGTILNINSAFLETLQLSASDVLHKNYRDIAKRLGACNYKRWNVYEEISYSTELTFRRSQHSIQHVYITTIPVKVNNQTVGAYAILHDITPQKEAEEQLAYTLKELENIKYALDESASVMIINASGTITYVNDMYVQYSGYEKEDLVGKYYRDAGLNHDHRELLETIKSGKVWRGQLEMGTKHHQSYWVSKTIVPLKDIDGNITHYVSIHNDITEQKALENKLHFEATHDSLTGLPNRAMLLKELNKVIEKGQQKSDEFFALLFLDCDNFKQINDEYGHHIGDEFLKAYTKRLKSCVRKGDRIYRLGGDEFIIILNVTNRREIEQIARRIHVSLQQSWNVRGYCLRTTTTIGVSIYPEDGESAASLLKNADDALYKGKREGKNNYILYQT